MKPFRPNKKWVITAVGLLFSLLIFKITLFFTAKPKVTADYVAEYNKMSRPEDYDPNNNAAPYYQKAFDAFVKMPSELRNPYINWPTDFNSSEQALLEEWLTTNSQAFEYLQLAADKPYYWLERKTKKDKSTFSMVFPELTSLRKLTDAYMWNAKLAALKDRSQTAFENVIDCCRAGRQKTRTPSSVVEQLVGLGNKQIAVCNALIILDRTEVDNGNLKLFQDALQAELDNDAYVPDFTAEKLFLYDAVQRTFIDNGRGTGRLAFRMAEGFIAMCCEWYNFKVYLSCFIGPTRNEIVEQIEQLFASFELLKTQNPWQLHKQDYFEKIDAMLRENFFMEMLVTSHRGLFKLHHKVKVQTEALITTIAILRCKNNTGRFPESLDKLVSSGYLQSVPMDPYSDRPLVYKLTEDNFMLYSVGEDFKDDGGITGNTYLSTSQWSSSCPDEYVEDIVFWPVKRLEDPRKNFDKMKAERERLNLRRR